MRLVLSLLLAFLLPLSVAAQEATGIDYTAWDRLAEVSERQLVDPDTDSTVLETLRAQLVQSREQFLAAQSQNAERIATVERQLQALQNQGDNEAMDPEITTRIATLEEQRTELRRPQVQASEALSRANGLISEIDAALRGRQTDALLLRTPTPFLPSTWISALSAGSVSVHAYATAFDPAAALQATLPVGGLVGLAGFGLLLILAARFGLMRVVRWQLPKGRPFTPPALLVASMVQAAIGVFGLLLVVSALNASAIFGLRGANLLGSIPHWGMVYIAVRWLSERLSEPGVNGAALPLTGAQQFRLALLVAVAVGWYIAGDALRVTAELDTYSKADQATLQVPLVLAGAVLLVLIARLVRAAGRMEVDPAEEDSLAYRTRIFSTISGLARLVAVASVIAALMGYVFLADWLLLSSFQTLALIGMVIFLQRLVDDLYTAVTARDGALAPVLAGLILSLAALPVLALIWGARSSDLTGLWEQALDGVKVGETTISLVNLATFAVIFAVVFSATRLVQGTLRASVLPKTQIDPGAQTAIVSGIGYIGVGLAVIIAVTAAGINLSGLAIVAGALSVGIGFGLQTIVSNFVSGIILLVERPISEGDWIEVGGQMGYVRRISVRATTIETFDRTNVIIPNADLVSGQVINWTKGSTLGRVIIPVGVAYGSDTRHVESVLREVATCHPNVILNPPPSVVFQGFGADSLNFEIRAILRDVNWMLDVKTEINHAIAERFKAEGIEIPFAQRDIWIRNPEALRNPPEQPAQ